MNKPMSENDSSKPIISSHWCLEADHWKRNAEVALKSLQASRELVGSKDTKHQEEVGRLVGVAEQAEIVMRRLREENTSLRKQLEDAKKELAVGYVVAEENLKATERICIEHAALTKQLEEAGGLVELVGGLVKMAKDELGVPQPNYPAPVVEAVKFIDQTLKLIKEWRERA